jgi:hypothetical protein
MLLMARLFCAHGSLSCVWPKHFESGIQCHTVSGERLAVVISTLFHDESAVVGRHVVALICKQGGFIYPFAVLDLVSIVLSFKTRT